MAEVGSPEKSEGSWIMRRRFMFVTIGFCMLTVGYILWNDMDSASAEVAVTMSFLTMGSTMASYVFGAVWQDVSRR